MIAPNVTVVIACHDDRQWPSLVAAVHAVAGQSPRPAETIVVVDHNPALLDRAWSELSGVTVLANRGPRGASGTRNTGGYAAMTPLVAFLDGDAFPRPRWLSGLVAPFADPTVVGTGGGIAPRWAGRRPTWFPEEFLWAVGGSYRGQPTATAPVRNVWSASMAVRRDAFLAVGGFREGFGKVGDRARPEDTDLCLRMGAAGGRWMYVPTALIDHPVDADRATFRFFLRRCFAEGRGKVALARLLAGGRSLGSERDYLRRTVPRAVGDDLGRALRGAGRAYAARAGAAVAGVAAAAAGGAVETLTRHRVPTPTPLEVAR